MPDLDLFGPAFQADPPAGYARLRRDGTSDAPGSVLVVSFASANRDQDLYADADRFDPGRDGQIAALTVLDREPPRYTASFMVRGLTELPVRVRRRATA